MGTSNVPNGRDRVNRNAAATRFLAVVARFERFVDRLERVVDRLDRAEDRLDRQRRPYGDGRRD
jgi:exonuclease VII small subunit